MKHRLLCAGITGVLAGCGGSSGGDGPGPDNDLPTTPPTEVSMVTAGGFDSPMDAVSSPDGKTFFFTAHASDAADPTDSAAVFSVVVATGETTTLHVGQPLEDPSGLLMSCDGESLYISDLGYQIGDRDADLEDEMHAIYVLDVSSRTLGPLGVSGIGEAAGLALGPDCETLYVSGYTEAGEPALFSAPISGGGARIVASGSPLVSPSGVFVDASNVVWVMDQLPDSPLGGALFAISTDGVTTLVADGLAVSEPAGVSLVAGGGTAVMTTVDEDGNGQLTAVEIASGDTTVIPSGMSEPAGLRTAREAGIFAIADSDGDAIFQAQ